MKMRLVYIYQKSGVTTCTLVATGPAYAGGGYDYFQRCPAGFWTEQVKRAGCAFLEDALVPLVRAVALEEEFQKLMAGDINPKVYREEYKP